MNREGSNMRRFPIIPALGILAFIVAQDSLKAQTANKSRLNPVEAQYEVLNPWAEVDPIPLRGISPRLESLAGKKIGLFANFKRAARPIAASIEKRLKAMYPDIQTSLFDSRLPNVTETETKNRDNFIAWIKGLDAAITVVGD
jgi:hypothetical protein